jgi:hypothetical protein
MDDYVVWEADSEILAEIGRCLFTQDLRVTVRLPAELAAKALARWQREVSDAPQLAEESHAQRIVRHRAGTLGLIGLSIESRGSASNGDDLVLDLDAWYIGLALEAADDSGLLDGLSPPRPPTSP